MIEKIPVLRSIAKFHQRLFSPMPLHPFPDYDAYWAMRGNEPPERGFHRDLFITARIPDGSSVLDIGCGNGAFLRHLKNAKPKCFAFGMDISAEAIRALAKKGVDGTVILPGRRLRQLTEKQFDYVVLMEVIEHVADAEDLLQQALEFQPKRIFITIPNVGHFIHRLRLLVGGRFPVTSIVFHMKEHIRFWTVKDFIQWSESLGCKVRHYTGQERTGNPIKLGLLRLFPGLFAGQMIYEIEPVSDPEIRHP